MVNALDMVTFKTSIYSALNINSKGKTLCLLNTVCVHLCVHVHVCAWVYLCMCTYLCICVVRYADA